MPSTGRFFEAPHRLGTHRGFFTDPGAEASGENHSFHNDSYCKRDASTVST